MDSFDEFSQSLNQRPENTRSSLIESQRCDDFCEHCRKQSRYTEPVSFNFGQPPTSFSQSEQQEMPKDRSVQYFQRTPLGEVYNFSGKPLNLSDFRNDTVSRDLFDNTIGNIGRTYVPSESWISQMDATSKFRNSQQFIPYDESGRTFNLSEFRATNPNSLQNLNDSKGKQTRRPHNADSSRIAFRQDSCEYSNNLCDAFVQTSQSHQNGYNGVTRKVPKVKYKQNCEMKSTLPFQEPITRRNRVFETLVTDHYYPGIIVQSVDGLIDFNKIAFGTVFGCDDIPLEIDQESVPMSLLEAFDLRIEYEQDLRGDRERRKLFCKNSFKNGRTKTKLENDGEVEGDSTKIPYWTHRDELKIASTIGIDLMTKAGNFPETPLTEAINCLLKAEKINSFDRNVRLAEDAIRTASDDQPELAALKSTCSFKLDLRKDETKTTNTYEPLAIISYIGTTKPNN